MDRAIIVNADDQHASYFLKFPADRIVRYGTAGKTFEEKNIEASVATAVFLGVSEDVARRTVATIPPVPGRMERIDEGQPYTVIVDYAHEPASFQALYDVVKPLKPKWIIHVFGPTGGGRDLARRPAMGRIAADHADRIIVTTDDPYDDDPTAIAQDVMAGVPEKKRKSASVIIDRRKAIEAGIQSSQPGDLVLITGKGSEQTMVLGGGKTVPWDDREIARQAIRMRSQSTL